MTTNTNTNTNPDVPIPAGVARTDEWQDVTPMPYRILFGDLRNIGGAKSRPCRPPQSSSPMEALTTAACTSRRTSYLGDDGLTSAQARELAAALLIEAADQVDRWAEQHRG